MAAREQVIYQEMEWRLRARSDLVTYAQTVPIPGVPQSDNYEQLVEQEGWQADTDRYDNKLYISQIETDLADHHILILKTLQDLTENKLISPDGTTCRRTMLFFPPGSAKSTYASVVFPTWYMGAHPESPIILTGYADGICKKHGKRARQICMSPEFKAIFDAEINPDTKAADNWALTNGSEYLSAGLQSGLTGNRAHGLIWDDPVKGRKAAESHAEQTATWDAYKDDARTRKVPIGWEIGIQTRWHERDLAGQILPEDWAGESGYIKCDDGNWWYVLTVPAIAEHEDDPLGREVGEPLWQDWFKSPEGDPLEYWKPLQLDSRSWGSLFQQTPTPPDGDFFKQSWVLYYDNLPKDLNYYISADYAVTKAVDADDPDFTSIGIWAMSSDSDVYFVTGWHGKVDSGEWTDILLDFVDMHKPLAHISGGGQIRRGTEPWMKRRMRERNSLVRLEWLPETHGKEENARSFQAMMQQGMIHWPRGNEEAEFVIRHLVGFGTLRYDDPVDMCSFMGRWVARMWEAKKTKAVEGPPTFNAGEVPIAQLGAKRLKKV
jgi:hypothetical protein